MAKKQIDIHKLFEARHIANTSKLNKRLIKAYHKVIDKIFASAAGIRLKNEIFNLDHHPVLKRVIKETLLKFHDEVELMLVNGIKSEWELSLEKNVNIISKALAGKQISEAVNKIIFDAREKALESFTNMRIKGLNLSDRVWKYTNQFQNEIEKGIYTGLSEGKPAAVMAREQKQYLEQPDKLFRRVKDASGKLVLSKSAKAYKPGKGIYRSSYKNAFRFTRDVTNRSYRTADHERWKSIPFVTGIEIRLSNNHPKFDICDRLVGNYPANYKHTGFHPQCLCYAIPKLVSDDQFDKYEDAVLRGDEENFIFDDSIKEIPDQAKKWYKENREKISKYKSIPYFLKDNKKFF